MLNTKLIFSISRIIVAIVLPIVANAGLASASGPASVSNQAAAPSCDPIANLDVKNFSNPTKIDNQYYPLVPGTQWTLQGRIKANNRVTAHQIIFTVTDLTKVVDGVTTRVLWDMDTNGGRMAEAELAFQAQDDSGNVWVFGEYPEDYDAAGKFIGAPATWFSGIANAKAGILVPGQPKVGTSFLQGFSPNINFVDCGKTASTTQESCDQLGCYTNVLVVNEWNPSEVNSGIQVKYYAPSMGNFKIGALNDPEAEILLLVDTKHLSADELAAADQEALKLEQHAYQVNDNYKQTLPIGASATAAPAASAPAASAPAASAPAVSRPMVVLSPMVNSDNYCTYVVRGSRPVAC
jgi:hypothetical protein